MRIKTNFCPVFAVLLFTLSLLAIPAMAQDSRAAIRVAIGYPEAVQRLGDNMPTGRGVPFGHVEGDPGEYRPHLIGPEYQDVTFHLRSGDDGKASVHGTSTARLLYGKNALAPGVDTVHVMTTRDFLTTLFLRADTTAPPITEKDEALPNPARVYTHSWIADLLDKQAQPVLRRVDHQVDQRDILIVAGVNNGRNTHVPTLLGSAYNAIAVGAEDADSSGGYTKGADPGRCKPDLVAPGGLTSYATPVVAACGAMLLEMGDRMAADGVEVANRSELIKAVLMAGCTKPEGWQPAEGKPLDERLGAGVVNLDRSLHIMENAQAQPATQAFGWDFLEPARGDTLEYDFEVGADAGPMTIVAAWNRRIDARSAVISKKDTGERFLAWLDAPRLADFDLHVYSVNTEGESSLIVASESRIDNVELIYVPKLSAGNYRLQLTRRGGETTPTEAQDPTHDVALAWAMDGVEK